MKEVQILVRDDLDGSLDASTVTFGWQGKQYEIDLSDKHLHELSELLQPYLEAARPVEQKRGPGRPPKRSGTPPPSSSDPNSSYAKARARKEQLTRVREWANANGWELQNKARVPYAVNMAYNQAHPDDPVPLADSDRFRRDED